MEIYYYTDDNNSNYNLEKKYKLLKTICEHGLSPFLT